MIVDKKGFILTNNHVIEQATKIQVQLNKREDALHREGRRRGPGDRYRRHQD